MNMHKNKDCKLFLMLPALLLTACVSGPTTTADGFGDSVRQMVRAQTLDQSTLASPSTAPIESTDGQMLEGALETYRATVSEQSDVGSEITINVGD
jgi:hypothetical protein